MKRKYLILTLAILSTTILLLTGCNENDDKTVPATSDTVVEEIPTEETEIETEPTTDSATTDTEDSLSDDETSTIENINGNYGNDVDMPDDGRANQSPDEQSEDVVYTDKNTVIIDGNEYEAVGSPDDTSWRRMTDEEAQAIIDAWKEPTIDDYRTMTDEDVEALSLKRREYEAAKAELNAGMGWSDSVTGKIYYNYYDYQSAMDDFQSTVVNAEMASPETEAMMERLTQ